MVRLNEGFAYAQTLIHFALFTVQNETPAPQVPEVRLHTHHARRTDLKGVIQIMLGAEADVWWTHGVMLSSNPVCLNWFHFSSALEKPMVLYLREQQ